MKRIAMIVGLAASAMLAGCGATGGGGVTSAGSIPVATEPATTTTAPVGVTLEQATQKLIVANEAYQSAALAVETAVDAGIVSQPMAVTLQRLNASASDLLEKGSRAALAADRFYYAERTIDTTDAIQRLLSRPTTKQGQQP